MAAVCLLVIYWHDNTLLGLGGYPFHKPFISLLKYEKDSSVPDKSNLRLDHDPAHFLVCRLQGVDSADSQYRWRWYDTTSPGHFRETETNGTVTKMNYTIVYPSSVVSQR